MDWREKNSILKYRKIIGQLVVFFLFLWTCSYAQTGDSVNGKKLFNQNCAACHHLDKKMTGPPLGGVVERAGREWLHKWIKNSAALISSGDDKAVAVFEEYNKIPMTSFPLLSEQDIDDVLAYTKEPPKTKAKVVQGHADKNDAQKESGTLERLLFLSIVIVFGMLVTALIVVRKRLELVVSESVVERKKTLWQAYKENRFLRLLTAIFGLLLVAYFAYAYMMQLGVDKGYKPIQPIHFSHKVHAGDNAIECLYCHSSARVSKTSGIPSLNVCMNCHKNISEYAGGESLEYGFTQEKYTQEIKKLYEATGWDENTQSYTDKTAPVKWVRIHNLPDFVYFNHSQHVSVAGVECQKCHGEVQKMEVVEQYAPLTMGWCVECHRSTNVKIEGSAYYEKIHSELSKKYNVEKLTVGQLGGLECGKCHY